MAFIDLVTQSQPLWLALVFLFSLAVGSFLNVVIYRTPLMLKRGWKCECHEYLTQEGLEVSPLSDEEEVTLSKPASSCPSCGHKIKATENIPVISWLFLRGKCSSCKTPISFRYPFVELLTALMSVAVAWHFGPTLLALFLILLTWVLVSLSFIDFDTQLLPDNIVLPTLWLGILLSLTEVTQVTLSDAVIGAMAGYLSLWSVYHLFKRLTGKEGMGYGDFKLLALLGAWMGWQLLPLIVLLSAVVGAVIGISLILFRGHDRNIPIPFGPYLAIAGWIALLWGEQITTQYLMIIGMGV